MSGGYFEYEQHRIQQAADDLNDYILKVVQNNFDYDPSPDYSTETLARFKQCALELERVSTMLHHIDYYISGDIGEKGFNRVWEEDIDPPKV